jgi:hypothetical protein
MSIFVKSIPALKPRTANSATISILYAVLLVIFAVTQLFTFEEFLVYIQSVNLPFSDTINYAFAPLLIVAEVFAIPFLLRMRLSPAFRYLSLGLGFVVAILWVFLSSWVVLSGVSVDSIGFLGTLVTLMPGWWAIFISLSLGILAAWSAWGLWPGKRTTGQALSKD